jgi:hypothetical protein
MFENQNYAIKKPRSIFESGYPLNQKGKMLAPRQNEQPFA